MTWIKRILLFVFLVCTATLLHYYLPQRDIVKIVDTDVKRMDISKGSPFWDRQDVGTDKNTTRDVRFISTVRPNGKTSVYRNEDTGWSFPFYLKFDSSDLSAKAQDMASDKDVWVAVTHYGWRIRLFSIFPNATKIKQVAGPNTFLIPWFNIAFLSLLALLYFFIWRTLRRWKAKRIDPISDKVEGEFKDASDAVKDRFDDAEKNITAKRGRLKSFMRRWFGSP
ncbi:DUF1523 family protein [Fretibacter rubidus]|uniref:DUF1523 family protein n=1 Tax=Fretibacter rubidus TaxID=570162 RepID=UPI003529FF4C